ncbi:alpha-2-macroglobulin family protein [Dyella tabacisoli]|uniref:Alpha-2-macroglobulin family protein n=1 Tax=Dyella tabacisoli TaxID=2282381 RepID=A0A369UKG7_9GAMM|nr:alpha-2-macroglobulin [Dyella tabacisoli]RDD81254.1 alpha-2-macroglobulin family protein [Dyella tabacisoli]
MDLLRFLLMLPVRLVHGLLYLIALILRPLIGNVSWSAPGWVPAAGALVRRRPLHAAATLVAVLALAAGGWFGWQWYKNRPKPVEPQRITFQVQRPELTDYTVQPISIHPLQVKFSRSAAPIELVGKPVTAGIAMQPAIKGQWSWTDDRTLRFVPAEDWPVGKHYEARFDKAVAFAGHVLMADDNFNFDTVAFALKPGKGEFYQDPQDATAKKTILPVAFNYPVDPAQFEKQIELSLSQRGAKDSSLKFTVTYDQYKLNAWIHSQPLALPRDDGAVHYSIGKGVRSSRGGDATDKAIDASISVPGLYSLAIQSIDPTLVDNDKYEPEQVLVVNVSGTVRDSELAGLTKAWTLPKRNPEVKQEDDEAPYSWSSTEVSETVLRKSQPLKLELVPTEGDYSALQSFKYHAEPGQRIYVRIEKGLKSFGGYILGQPRADLLTVPDYPKLLRFMADGSLLSMSGSKRVSVVSRNLPGMKVEIGRVLPDQLQHLVSLNNGNYTHPQLSYGFSEDHITDRFEQTRAFPKGDPGKAHYEGVDLGQYLKEGKRGVFLLHLSSYDPVAAAKRAKAAAKANADEQAEAAPTNANNEGNVEEGDPLDSGGADSEGNSDSEGNGDNSDSEAQVPGAGDTRLVVVTDLGMLVKRALDGSQDVFVQSIRNGQPVAGASVSVLALNGQTLYSETTSADGMVHFPTFKGLDRDKRPTLYLVKKADDLSFLPISGYDRQLDYSRFDIGGERNAANQGQLSAYLFSDRGIYRPGDTFNIGLIVRAASWTRSVAGIPLQAEIIDPRGVMVKQLPMSMDPSGFGELSYAPAETAPTGTWTVNLHIVKDGKAGAQIGSTTVQVKEFLPDRMKVDAKLSEQVSEGWVKPDQLKGIVDVQNLFGTPATDRRVEASLTLRPAWPEFRSWPAYHFYDIRRAKEGYEEALQDGKTDEKGHAEFALDLKKYADATYQLYFLSKAYEAEGGRSVAAAAQTLISSNDWLVGYKAIDALDYVSRGASRTVHLVAIDHQAKSIELKDLKAQLIERRYISVLTKQDSGVYKYDSKLKEVPVSEQPLNIAAGGMNYTLPTDKPGNYALVIRRADRTEVNRVEYSVAGAANVSRSLDRNAELQLNLSKPDYKPGEAVEIAVRAPYAGSGLITIERDKVYAHAWFHADTTSSVQHITVPADFEGNGYINVQYIRDPSSDEVFMSPLSYGVVPFSVNLDARRNPITVTSPALVKPGDTVTFKLSSPQPTKAVVFVVDEGILQVARYKLGDPVKFFFRKRMLEVGTSQILDLILPDFEKLMAMAAPGGDADGAIGRQLNPFKRKRDKPVAYWSGIVDVDGEKEVTYQVPDYFNGKLRVMAVSVSPDRIGTFEGATTVRGDFVLSPNVPTTLAPGDEVEVSVGVANNLTGLGGKQVPVAVTLKTGPQLQLVGNASQSISLGEMREGVALFRVKATDALGSANLAFTAGYGDKSAKQSVDVSVRPASTFRTTVSVGRVEANGKADLADLRKMYAPYAKRDVSISNLPLVLAQGLTAYLVDFPHYCTEQVLSRAMPALIFGQRPEFKRVLKPSNVANSSGATEADALASLFDVLHTRQNGQGGFGLWTATPDANAFLSGYAMHFMLEARDRNMSVPRDMFDAGNAYLKQVAADEGADSLESLRQRAYAVYLLTRQGNVTTNYLASVQKRLQDGYPKEWKNDLAAAWLAASYQMLKQDKQANELIAGPQKLLTRNDTDRNWQYGYYYDPLVRDASVLYLLAKHFPERAKALPPEALNNIVGPLQRGSFNTLSSAMTVLALDAYATQAPDNTALLGIGAVKSKDGSVAAVGKPEGMVQSASWDDQTARLRFTNGSNMPAWYVASQGGYDRDEPTKALREGIEIIRDYTDTDGKKLDQVTIGQEIDVHVKIRATGSTGVGNVAIVDLLPGGFEPVIEPAPVVTDHQADGSEQHDEGGDSNVSASAWRSPIGLGSSSWKLEYADIREDRVVLYGTANPDVAEFVYRIKATNAGKFIVPPAYGESLYDRTVQARSPGGAVLTVVRKP